MFDQNKAATYGSDPAASLSSIVVGAAYGPQVSTAVVEAARARGSTAINANDGQFGDPWPYYTKSLTVVFKRGSTYYTTVVSQGNNASIK